MENLFLEQNGGNVSRDIEIEDNRKRIIDTLSKRKESSGIELNYDINALTPYLRPEQLPFSSLSGAVSIDGEDFDLEVSKKGADFDIKIIDPSGKKHKVNRVEEDNMIGGIWKCEFRCGSYESSDHWAISVAAEYQGAGVADLLYALKTSVNEQPKFEHVNEGDMRFLIFYIKKGYYPCSIILPNGNEEVVSDQHIEELKERMKSSKEQKSEINRTPFALRLSLDPSRAEELYQQIK